MKRFLTEMFSDPKFQTQFIAALACVLVVVVLRASFIGSQSNTLRCVGEWLGDNSIAIVFLVSIVTGNIISKTAL